MTTHDIKECPFCGHDDIKIVNKTHSRYLTLQCDLCQAEGPVSVNENVAVNWWNKRAELVDNMG